MSSMRPIILGEYPCTLDERWRLTLPSGLAEPLLGDSPECILAKERAGCLSLWGAAAWQAKFDQRVRLVEQKIQAEVFGEERISRVQLLGRLLSTRHKTVELKGRRRLLVPESFRKFLGVGHDPPDNEVVVVGAAVCVEIWKPEAWQRYLEGRMPRFQRLFHDLSQ
jgi:MraZ protein